jgi:hypothetical protein
MFTFIIFNLKAEKESSTRKDRAEKRIQGFRFESAIYPLRVLRFYRNKSALQIHNTENSKQIFQEKELRGLGPNFLEFAVIFTKKCLSATPAIKKKNFEVHIFLIYNTLLRAYLSAL